LTQITASYAEKMILRLIFKENVIFFAENRQKSPKIRSYLWPLIL
jgi:hypothetical protein